LIDELVKHDVPFAATAVQVDGAAQALSVLSSLAFPLFLLFLFLGPRLMQQGGMGGPGGAGGGDSMNPFNMGKSKASLQMEPNTGTFRTIFSL
jgi:ATP-dependent Zn protease